MALASLRGLLHINRGVLPGFSHKLCFSTRKMVSKADVVFRNVTLQEAEKVRSVGERELTRTFAHLYDIADLSGYISEAYTKELYEHWINSKEHIVYGAFLDSGKADLLGEPCPSDKSSEEMVAYVLAGPCELPLPEVERQGKESASCTDGEIKRLYAHPRTFGSGIAEELMRNAMTWLRSGAGREKRDVYLGVYSDNPRAIKFYEKHNFTLCGEYKFVVGKQLDREFIMKNALS